MRKVHLLLSSARPTFQPFAMSHRALRATRIPPFTFVEPLFGLRHHQRDIIGSVLQDVHRGGVREALEVHVIHREEAVTCESDGKNQKRSAGKHRKRTLFSHPHRGKKGKRRPSGLPGLRHPLTSAGPPGVTELTMVPRSERPEFSPPTTWNPGGEKSNRCQRQQKH